MPLQKVKPGPLAAFPGGTWNTLIDLARDAQAGRAVFGAPGKAVPETRIRIKAAGGEIPLGGVVVPADVLDTGDAHVLKAYPVGEFNLYSGRLPMLVALAPIASNRIGFAGLYGPQRVKYATADGTPAFGETWGPDSTMELRKGANGFFILGGAKDGRVSAIWTPNDFVTVKVAGGHFGDLQFEQDYSEDGTDGVFDGHIITVGSNASVNSGDIGGSARPCWIRFPETGWTGAGTDFTLNDPNVLPAGLVLTGRLVDTLKYPGGAGGVTRPCVICDTAHGFPIAGQVDGGNMSGWTAGATKSVQFVSIPYHGQPTPTGKYAAVYNWTFHPDILAGLPDDAKVMIQKAQGGGWMLAGVGWPWAAAPEYDVAAASTRTLNSGSTFAQVNAVLRTLISDLETMGILPAAGSFGG